MIAARRVQTLLPDAVWQTPLSNGALATASTTLFTVNVGAAAALDKESAPLNPRTIGVIQFAISRLLFIKKNPFRGIAGESVLLSVRDAAFKMAPPGRVMAIR
jgi:hypothetical protein